MIADIDIHKSEVVRLCRVHRVRRLEVFGSAADGSFDPQRSDVDFLVEFLPLQPGEDFDTFLIFRFLWKRWSAERSICST